MKLAVHERQKTLTTTLTTALTTALTTTLTDLREDLDAEFERIRADIDARLGGQPSAPGANCFCFNFNVC